MEVVLRTRTLWLAVLCTACGSIEADVLEQPQAERVLVDGTPEADGVLAMLNDSSTTFEVLDIDAALDRRAAENLIAHRDGLDGAFGTADDDLFQTVDEVDGVSWVGEATMQALLDYALAEGWVVDPDLYGRVEGVDFRIDQAEATLLLANTAPFEVLDDEVPLDRRAAEGIVAGRPFASVEEVAAVSYVGTSSLTALRDFAEGWTPPGPLTTSAAQAALATSTEGLVWMSDIDDVLRAVVIPGVTSIDEASARDVVEGIYEYREGEAPLAERVAHEVSLGRMFDEHTIENRFWGEDQFAVADQWRAVRSIFETQLVDATVIRLGEYPIGEDVGGVIDIYVLGASADGDLVGFHTIAVEP